MIPATILWDGNPLGPGPIALSVRENAGEDLVLYAASASSLHTTRVSVQDADEFLERHTEALFVSIDVAAVHRQLHRRFTRGGDGTGALKALWAKTRGGRWVDLRLLDRQVRAARGDNNHRIREWKDLVESRHPQGSGANVAGKPDQTNGDKLHPRPEELRRVLNVFELLRSEATSLTAEDPLSPLPTFPEIPPSREGGLVGHWFEVQAAVSLSRDGSTAMIVNPDGVAELLARATGEFRRASAILARKAEDVQGCFRWNGNEVACAKGYPDVRRDRLQHWLRKADDRLCDIQNSRADVPRDAEGRPSSNPEHWSFWATCDESLWAWRHLFRMTEISRIISAEGMACPRYETAPLLRSLEPNLTVYRSLGVRVFRPREGHVFLAGRLHGLRIRCLAGVCVRRGYDWRASNRLGELLRATDPLEAIAGELFARVTTTDEGPGSVEAAARLFPALRDDDPDRYRSWTELAGALLDTIPLAIPPVLLTVMLRNDFGREDLVESDVLRFQEIFIEHVASLQSFLTDDSPELVLGRLGLDGRAEGFSLLEDEENTGTTGAALRNDLARRRRRRPINEYVSGDDHPATSREPRCIDPFGRKGLYQYRAWTLGGRLTSRAASATVRRQEVRMAAEEVMAAVVHDLCAAGYNTLGIAGDEFLLEIPSASDSREELEKVALIAHEASRRILWELAAPVVVTPVKAW